jgi:hypothetical protein
MDTVRFHDADFDDAVFDDCRSDDMNIVDGRGLSYI